MKIYKVFEVVHKARKEWHNKRPLRDSSFSRPPIKIYMDYEYWSLCMQEIGGEVSQATYEFYQEGTILGYDVYRVPPNVSGKKHPPFEVFICQ